MLAVLRFKLVSLNPSAFGIAPQVLWVDHPVEGVEEANRNEGLRVSTSSPSPGCLMLHYPKIPGSRNCPGGRCIAFEKYDGTNLHWVWNRNFGWQAFGTRRDQFTLTSIGIDEFKRVHTHLQDSVEVFQAGLGDAIERVFRHNAKYHGFTKIKVFTEYLGPNSFAGLHKSDDPKHLMIFDILVEPFGFIGPEQFAHDFAHLPSARVVYRGRLTGRFADDVREGKYDVAEGVVCKGGVGGPDVWMVKIKTQAYQDKLQAAFVEKWEDFWE